MNLDYLYIGLMLKDENGFREIQNDGCNNYKRIETTFMDWIVSEDYKYINSCVTFRFPMPTDLWGWIGHFGVFNKMEGGDLLVIGDLRPPRRISAGIQFEINNTQIELSQLGMEIENG